MIGKLMMRVTVIVLVCLVFALAWTQHPLALVMFGAANVALVFLAAMDSKA